MQKESTSLTVVRRVKETVIGRVKEGMWLKGVKVSITLEEVRVWIRVEGENIYVMLEGVEVKDNS